MGSLLIERFDMVGAIITVGVCQVKDGRSCGSNESFAMGSQPLDVIEMVCPGDGFVHDAIAIRVSEQANSRQVTTVFGGKRVVAHLGDEETTLGIPGDIHRVAGERLRGHELQLVVTVDLPGGERFLG